MTDQEILDIAYRTATVYRHRSDPDSPSYGFVNHTVIDFGRKVERAVRAELEKPVDSKDLVGAGMTHADMLPILHAWQATIRNAEADIERFIDPLKCSPESALYAIPWKLMDAYTNAVAAQVGDKNEWLAWYWCDNNMGAKKMEAGCNDKRRKIKTLRDLAWLIGESNK